SPDPRASDPLTVDDGAGDTGETVAVGKARQWVVEAWQWMLRNALGLSASEPAWLDRPALTRLTISSPDLLKQFAGYNRGRPPHERVRAQSFCLLAHPVGQYGSEQPSPIAPYESDPGRWQKLPWYDRHTGKRLRIVPESVAESGHAFPGTVVVQTYRTA